MFSLPPELKSLEAFWALSRDDIYDDNWEKLRMVTKDVPAATMTKITTVYTLLAELVARGKSQDSDLSSTSDEGCKLEIATQGFANAVCNMFLHISGLHSKKTYPTWDYDQSSFDVKFLFGKTAYVRPDGVIVYKPERGTKHPYVWIEAKPLEYAEGRSSSKYYRTIPQKAAECLALVQSIWNETDTRDYEVFGIEFCHRYASFWTAKFTHAYLQNMKYDVVLAPECYVILKRSKTFDLIESKDRYHFTQWFAGLLEHISR
ncbi:hypothetical protein Unana1_08895 [Umbelopsis nana]